MSTGSVDDYGWTSTAQPQSCGYLAPKVVELLTQLEARRVLDLGSGNGQLCALLSQRGLDVVGMEYDAKGVELSRQLAPAVPFYNFGVQDDHKQLLEHERPFDVVVSTEVVEHLYSPHLLPRFAAGVLGSGGHLIVTTPYHGYAKNLALSIFGKWDNHHLPLWHGGHIKFWSKKTLSRLMNENGFEVVGFHGVGRVPYLWKSMVLVCRKI